MYLGLHPASVALMEQSFMARGAKPHSELQKSSHSTIHLQGKGFDVAPKCKKSNIVLQKQITDCSSHGNGSGGLVLAGHGGRKTFAAHDAPCPERQAPAGVAGGPCAAQR